MYPPLGGKMFISQGAKNHILVISQCIILKFYNNRVGVEITWSTKHEELLKSDIALEILSITILRMKD